MNATAVLTWIMRYGHVLSATCWVGGYALLALVILPFLRKGMTESMGRLMIALVRVLTYTGTLTIGFGLVLILHTRGYGNLFSGSLWGILVLACIVIAIALLGIGDGALRPAIKRFAAGGDASGALLWARVGFALTALAIGLMTATVYVV